MHFRIVMIQQLHRGLIDLIWDATEAVKRPVAIQADDLNFKSVLIKNGDRIDGSKVETFRREMLDKLMDPCCDLDMRGDRLFNRLIRELAPCQSVYIVWLNHSLIVRGSSSDTAFAEIWQYHRETAENFAKAARDLANFDQTGNSYGVAVA